MEINNKYLNAKSLVQTTEGLGGIRCWSQIQMRIVRSNHTSHYYYTSTRSVS